ncbi:sodium-dependent dopamine transporter isoform X2 [Bombyx mori]|uniref:sodium-dependent dopamine transporter isoform X2 n=1 Tax=Bombyx mori TaxID=7091 RepID=UPI002ED16589
MEQYKDIYLLSLHIFRFDIQFRFILQNLRKSLQEYPLWTRCQKAEHCIPVQDVISRCRENNVTKFSVTSAHLNYMETFSQVDRHVLTTKLFIMALVWIFNFFFSTIQTDLLIKLFRLTAMFRLFSTLITVLFIVMTTKSYAATAFVQILDIKAPHSYTLSIDHISYTFGIGFLGLYDYGSVSPYTMVDNAVVAFTVAFTTSALVRAWIVRILYLALKSCVEVEDSVNPHYLVFAILPMSTEFLHTHKLYTFYIYFNIMFASMAYLTMLTTTMSKLLQSEFRSVKNIYIIGILCFLGFSLSLPIIVSVKTAGPIKGLLSGLRATVLYLGGFRVAVVMWVYGVQRFSTDIHFWLGFKPTKFWTMCWTLLPIVLLMFLIQKIYLLTQVTDFSHNVSAVLWIVISLTTVGFFQIKTLARYLVRNNLAAVFNSNKRYGPPDAEDRRKRENYDETISHRQCKHNCNILDDVIDCDHMPIMVKTKSTTSLSSLDRSMTNIYEADPLNTLTTSSGWFKAESDN